MPLHWGISFPIGGILTICVVHIATVMENIGDTTSIVANAEDRPPTTDELVKTIRGDALGSVIACFFNGMPVCSATQNAGVIAMSGCASRYVTALGSIIFGALAFFPKFAQILALIPDCVLGGVLVVAFGTIMSSGIRVIGMGSLTKRNFTIVSLACAVGIGGRRDQRGGTGDNSEPSGGGAAAGRAQDRNLGRVCTFCLPGADGRRDVPLGRGRC